MEESKEPRGAELEAETETVETVTEIPVGVTGGDSREVPPPHHDSTLWDKVRKGLTEGYQYAADRTDLYTKIGKRRLTIIGINRNIERSFHELGEKVYNLIAGGTGKSLEEDLAVKELYEKIRSFEGDLTAQEAAIEMLLQESREKKEGQEKEAGVSEGA